MKLTLIASLLLASSAHAALFPADHPSHLGELTKDIIKFKKLGQALPPAISAPSSGIRRALTRARTSNRRHLEDPCIDETSKELEGALDIARATTYEDIVCIKDENTATQKCTLDSTDAIIDGVLNDAVAICASNNDDGVVFTFDAEISCDDGTSFSMIASPLTCFSNCYDYDPVVTYVTSLLPASTFVGKNETENCNWDAFSMDPIAVDEGSGEYYDYGPDDSPFSPFDDVCIPMDLGEDAFGSLFGEYLDPYYTCVEENDPHNCHLDFTQAFNNGEFDALAAICEGDLYILSVTLDCPGDDEGIVKYSYFPICFNNCSVDLLTTNVFVEGGSACGDCTVVNVGDVLMYSSGNDDSRNSSSPEKTHVSLFLCFFAM